MGASLGLGLFQLLVIVESLKGVEVFIQQKNMGHLKLKTSMFLFRILTGCAFVDKKVVEIT
jgi:hypothetical protein